MSRPFLPIIDVSPSSALPVPRLGTVYGLLAAMMLLTFLGVVIGTFFAPIIFGSPLILLFFLAELVILFTSRFWISSSPLNVILFGAFPFLSGVTVTPFLLGIALQYANGAVILINATVATAILCAASAVYASMAKSDLSFSFGRILFQSLLGLIVFGFLQIFFPSLRGTGFEMIVSGVGIVTFVLFLSVDLQRAARRSGSEHPMIIALSLYLDIFNLFLYVVRFMLALSGSERR